MKSKCIFVIDPAVETPALDPFNKLQKLSQLKMSYHLPAIQGHRSLVEEQTRSDVAAVIVLGSAANVDENRPWQKSLEDWLKDAFAQDIPSLGICYGHQLFAWIHGADVGFHHPQKVRRSGVHKITFSSNAPICANAKLNLYYSHKQAVLNLNNSDLESFATSLSFANDFFKHKSKKIFGIQAHPEATPMFIDSLSQPIPNDNIYQSDGEHFLLNFLKTKLNDQELIAPDEFNSDRPKV